MYRVLGALAIGCFTAMAFAQEVTTCRSPSGKAYYHFDGFADKSRSGWNDDKISKGVFTLTRLSPDAVDLLYVDAANKPVSSTQDGAIVRLIRKSATNVTVLVFYPTSTTEIYTFFAEKDGSFKFSQLQSRTGDTLFPKSSLMRIPLIVTDDSGIVTGHSGDRDRCR
jgi:hypothetical protein